MPADAPNAPLTDAELEMWCVEAHLTTEDMKSSTTKDRLDGILPERFYEAWAAATALNVRRAAFLRDALRLRAEAQRTAAIMAALPSAEVLREWADDERMDAMTDATFRNVHANRRVILLRIADALAPQEAADGSSGA